MKVTVEWLQEFVETKASAEEIGDTLTMLGLELEAVEQSALGPVLDFKVTPNRGDCLSVIGLARELAAKDSDKYKPTQLFMRLSAPSPVAADSQDNILIEDTDLCPRYAAGIFRNAKVGPSSPRIQGRLTACGMRPISIIVDTTNYVMLELGQPLHAFDLEKLAGERIIVKRAGAASEFVTLDGVKRKLTKDMLLICDGEQPVALAGVMGGQNSEVSDSTKDVLLESAHFDPVSVRRTRRSIGLSTEASYRFERYVDPAGVTRAINRFSELLAEQGGPSVESISDVGSGRSDPQSIQVRNQRWKSMLGTDVPVASAATILQSIGCAVSEQTDVLNATPPSWRSDLAFEEDLVEEIGRLWGYDRIPETLPFGSTPMGGESAMAAFRTSVRLALLRLGFTEVLTHSLVSESSLDAADDPVALRNPGSPEHSILRSSLLPGLAAVAAKNRGQDLFLFEVGKVFSMGKETRSLALLMHGGLMPDQWEGKTAVADFYALKGVTSQVASLLHRNLSFEPADDKRLHPSRQATVSTMGVLGEVNPSLARELDLPPQTLIAELDLDALFSAPEVVPTYKPLSPFPSVRRDLAFVLSKSIPFAQIETAVANACGDLLEDVTLFDVYEGKSIEPGTHSLAIALTLRHRERTLTDEEANAVRDQAVSALAAMGAKPR